MSNPTLVIDPLGDSLSGSSGGNARSSGPNHTVIQEQGTDFMPKDSNEGRKIAGFLVSYSRIAGGESWPLYLGKNVIGKQVAEGEVLLREKTVSGEHAIINVRRVKLPKTNEDKLVFAISDNNSTTGTHVNDEDLMLHGFKALLNPGDQLTIGGYRLYLVCIDTVALDLTINDKFIHLDETDNAGGYDYDQREPSNTRVSR